VTLVEVVTLKERFVRRLTGGARAFPPEDCGSIPGYEECLAIRNGEDTELEPDEVEERKEWLGDWQPERFEFETVRKAFDL